MTATPPGATRTVRPWAEGPTGSTNGLGVIVVPRGGWTVDAWSHESLDVVRWLTSLGRMATIDAGLAAPLPEARRPTAIGDLVSTDEHHQARVASRAEVGERGAVQRPVELQRHAFVGDHLQRSDLP